ncbi:MAG: hypothetical protein ACFFAO_02135 [Candidatus Hermodarchaeota archaeon]
MRTLEKEFKKICKKRIIIENKEKMYSLINILISKFRFRIFSIDSRGISMNLEHDYRKSKTYRYNFSYMIHFHFNYGTYKNKPVCNYEFFLYRYPNNYFLITSKSDVK